MWRILRGRETYLRFRGDAPDFDVGESKIKQSCVKDG